MSFLSQTRLRCAAVASRMTVSRGLIALALLVLLAIAAATAHQLLNLRSAAITDTDRQLRRLDMVFAEQTGRAVETVDFVLNTAIEILYAARRTPPADTGVIEARLHRRANGIRQLTAVALTDKSGKVIVSSRPEATGDLGETAQRALAFHATHPDAGLRISEPLRLADRSWAVLLTRRIANLDGGFDGIAIALLNLAYFQDFFRSVELDDKDAIVLHHRDGTVLTRYPVADAIVGTSFADLPPFKDVLSKGLFGSILMRSPVDGSLRLVAIRALRAFPLAVNVSVDVDETLAGWRRQALLFGVGATAAAISTVGLLLLLARRARENERLVAEYAQAKEAAERANIDLRQQIAERERAEAALNQSQRIEAIGQLTGGVAHDFNNLLTIVLGNVDLLERTPASDERNAARLAAIRTAAERGALLIGQLLAFARRQKLSPRPVDLNGIITSMDGLLRSALGNHIALEQHLDSSLHRAMIDPTQIELVILNLVINARDAMPAGGTMTIETANVTIPPGGPAAQTPAGDYVTLAIHDTGHGMPVDVLAKVFEPFFTTKPPGAGSGLGLSQVLGTTQQLGGDVRIESRLDVGTTVRVFLPRATGDMETVAITADTGPRRTSANNDHTTILLVDDDLAVRNAISDLLEGLGYRVRAAADGETALDLLRTAPEVDVLLTDVAMPVMTGPALAREAVRVRPGLPVIFMSGYANPHQLAMEQEGTVPLERLLQKPFRPSQLTEQLDAVLGRAEAPAARSGQPIGSAVPTTAAS